VLLLLAGAAPASSGGASDPVSAFDSKLEKQQQQFCSELLCQQLS